MTDVGSAKAMYGRLAGYIGLFTYPNTVLILMGVELSIYIILLFEIIPAILIMFFDWKFIMKQEFDFGWKNTPMLMRLSNDVEAIKEHLGVKT